MPFQKQRLHPFLPFHCLESYLCLHLQRKDGILISSVLLASVPFSSCLWSLPENLPLIFHQLLTFHGSVSALLLHRLWPSFSFGSACLVPVFQNHVRHPVPDVPGYFLYEVWNVKQTEISPRLPYPHSFLSFPFHPLPQFFPVPEKRVLTVTCVFPLFLPLLVLLQYELFLPFQNPAPVPCVRLFSSHLPHVW